MIQKTSFPDVKWKRIDELTKEDRDRLYNNPFIAEAVVRIKAHTNNHDPVGERGKDAENDD